MCNNVTMLTFIQNPDFRTACKDLATFVRDFERSRIKREGSSFPIMERSCISRAEAVASIVHQCISSMDLRRLHVESAKVALGQHFKPTPWNTELWKLLSVLEEMEKLGSLGEWKITRLDRSTVFPELSR